MGQILKIGRASITSFPDIAATLSILASDNKFDSWICNNLSNIVYMGNRGFSNAEPSGDYYDRAIQNPIFEAIPFLSNEKILKHTIQSFNHTFSDFIISSIDRGCYLFTNLNNYYFPFSQAFQQRYYDRPTFIYGYTDDRKVCIADFYHGRKYDYYQISFDEIEKAYSTSVNDYVYVINLADDCVCQIDLDYLKSDLFNYLESRGDVRKFSDKIRKSDLYPYFGISYYDELIKSIKLGTTEHTRTHTLHILCDHATLMNHKLDILWRSNIIASTSKYEKLKIEISEISELSMKCRNLNIKQWAIGTETPTFRDDSVRIMTELKDKSSQFTMNLLSEFKSKAFVNEFQNKSIISSWESIQCLSTTQYATKIMTEKPLKYYQENLLNEYVNIVNIDFDFIPLSTESIVIGFTQKDAKIVHFSNIPILIQVDANEFKVFNYGQYSNDVVLLCEKNRKYKINLDINLNTQKFDVTVSRLGDKWRIASSYLFNKSAKQPLNIGQICLYNATPDSFYIENLSVDGQKNYVGNTALLLEKGNATRYFGFETKKMSIELLQLNNKQNMINTINLANKSETVVTFQISQSKISLNKTVLDKQLNIISNLWYKVTVILDESSYCVLIDDKCICRDIPVMNESAVDRLILSTTGVLYIKKITVLQ